MVEGTGGDEGLQESLTFPATCPSSQPPSHCSLFLAQFASFFVWYVDCTGETIAQRTVCAAPPFDEKGLFLGPNEYACSRLAAKVLHRRYT